MAYWITKSITWTSLDTAFRNSISIIVIRTNLSANLIKWISKIACIQTLNSANITDYISEFSSWTYSHTFMCYVISKCQAVRWQLTTDSAAQLSKGISIGAGGTIQHTNSINNICKIAGWASNCAQMGDWICEKSIWTACLAVIIQCICIKFIRANLCTDSFVWLMIVKSWTDCYTITTCTIRKVIYGTL